MKKKLGIIVILMVSFLFTNVYAITSDEVIYDKEGSDVPTTDALDELYDELHICSTVGNATAGDILSGKTAYVKGQTVTGTIPSKAAETITPGTANKTIASGQYLSGVQTIKGDANLTAANIKTGVSIFGTAGTFTSDATATAAQMLSGATAYVKGAKVTGTIGSKAATTYTPTTKNQTIASGQYLSGVQTIKGDANLVARNIKKGTSIFGVTGTYEGEYKVATFSDAPATIDSYYKQFTGSYVSMANEICESNQNYCTQKHTKICLDLGFSPSNIVNASLKLFTNSGSYFRMSRGVDMNNNGTTTYRYSSYLTGIYNANDAQNGYTMAAMYDTNPNLDTANFSTYSVSYNGASKLCFEFIATHMSNSSGSTNHALSSNATAFTISGTVVYK